MHISKIFNFSNDYCEPYSAVVRVKPLPFDWKKANMDGIDAIGQIIANSLPDNQALFWDTKISRKRQKMELKIITYY